MTDHPTGPDDAVPSTAWRPYSSVPPGAAADLTEPEAYAWSRPMPTGPVRFPVWAPGPDGPSRALSPFEWLMATGMG